MSIRDQRYELWDVIPVNNVLVSVFDKSGLERLIPALLEVNPDVAFLSTGGTYRRMEEILTELLGSESSDHLVDVASYTGAPEMEGGLVKTLHPKIHAGILGERENPAHHQYLADFSAHLQNNSLANIGRSGSMPGLYIDMLVVNLYPFERVIADPNSSFETARSHIDIGGPTMLRAAAKNFMSCCPVIDPLDYDRVIQHVRQNDGTTFAFRASMAYKVFDVTARYDALIASYLSEMIGVQPQKLAEEYKFV